MARRSSARLRGRRSATPQRVSLSHDDAPFRTPRTAPSNLASLEETEELPGAFPRSPSPCPNVPTPHSPRSVDTCLRRSNHLESDDHGATRSAIAKSLPRSESSNSPNAPADAKSLMSHTRFTFRREHSLQLSPEAKKLMEQNREASVRIRKQMATNPEQTEAAISASGRKLATPRTKKTRFSDAHAAAFNKMTSIAGHASAYRTQAKETKTTAAPPIAHIAVVPPSSLKRIRSQAELQAGAASPSGAHKLLSIKHVSPAEDDDQRGPLPSSKRIKRAAHEDPSSSRNEAALQSHKPTIPVPSTPSRTPAKRTAVTPTPKPSSSRNNLLSSKSTLLPTPRVLLSPPQVNKSQLVGPDSPSRLLTKSPSKAALFPKSTASRPVQGAVEREALLSRTPMKGSPKKSSEPAPQPESQGASRTPLLSRMALKKGVSKTGTTEQSTSNSTPVALLARSPSKGVLKQAEENTKTPHSADGKTLLGRLNLLRASPVKSILRSPQRLYSDDPEKIAAGTHLATPEKSGRSVVLSSREDVNSKRVDFTSSTKQRELDRKSEETPSFGATKVGSTAAQVQGSGLVEYPTLPAMEAPGSPSPQKRRQTAGPGNFTFRADEHGIVFGTNMSASPVALKRPAPTIRHVSSGDTTSVPMANGSKKRKFEFENEAATINNSDEQDKENEKEVKPDAEEISQGPAKRMKTASKPAPRAEPSPVKSFMRKPTLGVKPKGTKTAPPEAKKRTTTISQSRLNALAQPKRR